MTIVISLFFGVAVPSMWAALYVHKRMISDKSSRQEPGGVGDVAYIAFLSVSALAVFFAGLLVLVLVGGAYGAYIVPMWLH